MKKVVISQSNYIPWRGFFDLIASADEFVMYDDMQYTRRDWRNKNYIKTPSGLQRLTVPVKVKGKYFQTIRDTEIGEGKWKKDHLKAIYLNYSKAPHFEEVISWVEPIYLKEYTHLFQINHAFIKAICNYLGINTIINDSSNFKLKDGKTDRLIDLCKQLKADEYITAPAAKNYIEESKFKDSNIKLTWYSYSGYSDYEQLWGEFTPQVSVLDLLFNCGVNSNRYMKHERRS